MSIEIVFFDAGETLVRPHPSFPELFASVCTRLGHQARAEDVAAVQNRLAPYLVDLVHDTGVVNPSFSSEASRTFWTHLYRRFLGELGIDDEEVAQTLYATFSDRSSYGLFDDVMPALRDLTTAGYRIGLISNFEGWLEDMLVDLEVGDFFEVKVISGRAQVEKPDRRIYEIALEEANVVPGRAAHVGDSVMLDIEPATAAGMNAILLDRRGRSASPGVPTIRSLKELPSLLAKMSA